MKLSTTDIDARLSSVPGWTRQGDVLTRQFTFKGFPDAIAFVTRLAFDAEAADHHPDLHVNYKRVTVTWTSHDQGGITEKDFEGVQKTDEIAKRLGA
jgi:4a-hydroxytetrahydrobiopterin dehydratase